MKKAQPSVYVLDPRLLTLSEIDCKKENAFACDIVRELKNLRERKKRVGTLLRSKFLKRLDEAKEEKKEEEEEEEEEEKEYKAISGVIELDMIKHQNLHVKQLLDLRRVKKLSWMKPPTPKERARYHKISFTELTYPKPEPIRVWTDKNIELKLKASVFSTRRRSVACELKLDVKTGTFS